MEQRTAKVNINAAGGTASKGSKTCKVTLPTKWLEKMGVSKDCRELDLIFDGTKIMIYSYLDGMAFAKQQRSLGHDVRILRFFNNETLCSTIFADFTDRILSVENEDVNFVKTAFGNNKNPSWEDFQYFLEERCIPRQRAGLREYLEALGLEEYDPLSIIKRTQGRMAEDQQWIKIEEIK